MGGFFTQQWRELPKNDENLQFVKCYQPKNKDVKQLRILLHGPVGAGKSSFINSVESALQGQVSRRAPTDAISGTSFTKKYKAYSIANDRGGYYPFIFNDIMGFEQNADNGVDVGDIILAMKGHVKEGYQFNPQQHLKRGDQCYKISPTLNDRVHVLVSVAPADSLSLLSEGVEKKMREVRLAANDLGIPQLAILTKVDEACPDVRADINYVYTSELLKKQVNQFSTLLGLPPNCIFLLKNYKSEMNVKEDVDKLVLDALRQMIICGEKSLNGQ